MIDFQEQAAKSQQSVIEGIQAIFPYEGRTQRLEADRIWIEQKPGAEGDYGLQKEIKAKGGTLALPVYGNFKLIDKESGKVIDRQKKVKIASLPLPTLRNSYIVKGSEYQIANQMRLLPGVYTRVREDGDLESQVNLARGLNFRIWLNPKTYVFYMVFGTASRVMLYHVLTALGVGRGQMDQQWGKEITEANAKKSSESSEIRKLYKILFRNEAPSDLAPAIAEIADYLSRTEIDKVTTKTTLGKSYSKVDTSLLLSTTQKILRVLRKQDNADDRDSLEFKRTLSVDDFLKERLTQPDNVRKIRNKLRNNIDRKSEIRQILVTGLFNQPIESFFTKGDTGLSSTPEQTNPLHMISESDKVVLTGTGGITNPHAITTEARAVHPSSLGFIDPIATPESARIGTTLHLPLGVKKKGQSLTTSMYDVKSGKLVDLPASEAHRAVVSFRDQYKEQAGKLVPRTRTVKASANGTIKMVPTSRVQYVLPTAQAAFSLATNMLPFLPSNQGNRAMMASKQLAQALPLINREAPLVQVVSEKGRTYESVVGQNFSHRSPAEGAVTRVDSNYIYIKATTGKSHKVPIYRNFPLNGKTGIIDSDVRVKAGDKVRKGQLLADSNFTKNGQLALGINARVAYVPHNGMNFEDGISVSESFAKKATSDHMYKLHADVDANTVLNLKKFRAYYPNSIDLAKASKLDDNGVVKRGQKVRMGDVLIAVLRKEESSPEDRVLSKIHRSFVRPYKNRSIIWEEEDEGEVVEVIRTSKRVEIHVRTKEVIKIGDKLSSRNANKGTVTTIIADNDMPHTRDGKPIDVMMNPMGIPSRINPSQILETVAGKVAEKTGRTFTVRNFSGEDYRDSVEAAAKSAGVQDKEDLIDPNSGKTIPSVTVGNQYMLKLDHPTRKKFSARAQGPGYTAELQPTRGKHEGGQALDALTLYSMLSHGALHNLREMSTYKAEKNDEVWRALQMGQALPAPQTTFAFQKFTDMLRGAGVNVQKDGNQLSLSPLTDKHTLAQSEGEILNSQVVRGKDLRPEKGGLFDPEITGGIQGDRWNHIKLNEPMPNPVFENAIKAILDMKQQAYDDLISGKRFVDKKGRVFLEPGEGRVTAGKAFQVLLKKINPDEMIARLIEQSKTKKGPELDKINKKIRYLKALQENKIKPQDYVVQNVPVIPARLRPVYALADGSLDVAEVNHLYRDLIEVNNHSKEFEKLDMPEGEKSKLRDSAYQAMKAVAGLAPSIDGRNRKGLIDQIRGNTNKEGFFQNRIMRRRQEMTGRSTIVPDPELGLDQVSIPEEMAWKIYQPHVVRNLHQQGYRPLDAREQMEKRTPLAKKALEVAMRDRPVMLNRAPSLHKFSVMAFKPEITTGKAIKLNPLVVKGYSADFNGDSCSVYTTVLVRYNGHCLTRRVGDLFKEIVGKSFEEMEADSCGGTAIYEIEGSLETLSITDEGVKWVSVKELTFHTSHGPCYEVETHTGKTVVATEHHNFSYIDDELDLVGVKTEEMPEGCLIPAVREFSPGGYKSGDLTLSIGSRKVQLGEDLAWLLGFYAGDGSCSHYTVAFTETDPEVLEKIRGIVKDAFGADNKLQGTKKHPKCKVLVYSKDIEKWFVETCGKGYDGKVIPDFIFNSCEELRERYIQGVMDAEGSICADRNGSCCVRVEMKNEYFIQQIQTLMASVGIMAYTRKGKIYDDGSYTNLVGVQTADLSRVQFSGEKARKYERMRPHFSKKRSKHRYDIIPFPGKMVDLCREIGTNARRLSGKGVIRQHEWRCTNPGRKINVMDFAKSRRGYISRSIAFDIIHTYGWAFDEYGEKWLGIVKNEKLMWERVERIEETERQKYMCDFSVPEGEMFSLFGGLITHNTMSVHVPISEDARQEAFKMLPSRNLWNPRNGELMNHPSLEAVTGLYMHTHTKKGRDEVNAILPKGWKVTGPMTEKSMVGILTDIAKRKPGAFTRVVNSLKDIGNREAFHRGLTIGMEDLRFDPRVKKRIFAEADKKARKKGNTDEAVISAYMEASKKLDDAIMSDRKMAANGFRIMADSGAKGNRSQIRQILAAPVLVQDISGKTVPVPIKRSYAEGLDMGDYWASMSGARKGMIDRALQTSEPGALSKELLNSTVSEVIAKADCGTIQGIEVLITDRDINDRYLAKTVRGVGRRNDLVTHHTLSKAKRKKIKALLVRSPLTCASPQGICQKCYGLDENGKPPAIGKNVGVAAGQAIGERATQLTMRTFHTGAAVGGGSLTAGFQRVKEILEMPRKLRNQAALAKKSGKISSVNTSPIGGWDVMIGDEKHHVTANRRVLVKKGQTVKAGDRLSDGAISPQELLELKGMRQTQDYLVSQVVGEYANQGVRINRKIAETAIRPLTNMATVMHHGGHETLVPGDHAPMSEIESFNRRQTDPSKRIQAQPLLRGINTRPLVSEDWLSRLNFQRLHQTIQEGAAQSWKSDIASPFAPLAAYAYGPHIGKKKLT